MAPIPRELPVSESIFVFLAAQRSQSEADAATSIQRIAEVIDARTQTRRCKPFLFAAAGRLLALIGLPPRRRALAQLRIDNARRYALKKEFGAAMFELRQFKQLVSRSRP